MIYAQPAGGKAESILGPGTLTFAGSPLGAAATFLQAAAQQYDRSLCFDYVASRTGHFGATAPG